MLGWTELWRGTELCLAHLKCDGWGHRRKWLHQFKENRHFWAMQKRSMSWKRGIKFQQVPIAFHMTAFEQGQHLLNCVWIFRRTKPSNIAAILLLWKQYFVVAKNFRQCKEKTLKNRPLRGKTIEALKIKMYTELHGGKHRKVSHRPRVSGNNLQETANPSWKVFKEKNVFLKLYPNQQILPFYSSFAP